MSQISPPIRIVLVAAIAFLAAWMLFLKPKASADTVPAAATPAPNVQTGAPAVSAPGKAVQLAQKAAAQESGAAPAAGGQTTAAGTTATPATAAAKPAAPALPAAALRVLPRDVARALKARKVLVLGVIATRARSWAPMADDDRAVRDALRHVNRYRGDVFVKRLSLSQLAAYGPLFTNLGINQTPSVVVVDRNLEATTIAGYLDRVAINQAIVDARRASTPKLITDRFLHRVNVACARIGMLFERFPLPATRAERRTFAERVFRLASKRRHAFAAIPAPARWKPLKARMIHAFGVDVATAHKLEKAKSLAKAKQILSQVDLNEFKSLDRKLDSVGATACVADRRS